VDTVYFMTESRQSVLLPGHRRFEYVFPDGHTEGIWDDGGWCWSCSGFVRVEVLRELSELEAELGEAKAAESERPDLFVHPARDGLPEIRLSHNLMRRVEWRRTRASPARCLECGSIEIVPLHGKSEFIHQLTSEKVTVRRGDPYFRSSSRPPEQYTPEGIRLS
jgi:hypothetical protein